MNRNVIKRAVALLLCVMLAGLSSVAGAQSVSPVSSLLLRQIVAGKTFTARLAGYAWWGDETEMILIFTLCERESYEKDQIESLQEGDEITVGGFPYQVATVENDDGLIVVTVSGMLPETFHFWPGEDGYYTVTTDTDDPFWQGNITVECPVSPNAVYQDWSDGGAEAPVTHKISELMERLMNEEVFLDENNTEITFDETGSLSVVLQHASPLN